MLASLLPMLLAFWLVRDAGAETQVDVSEQWNSRARSAVESPKPSTAPAASVPTSEPTPEAALDCGCEVLTPAEKLEECTYAFTGEVMDVSPPKKSRRFITFDVDEIFKGSPKQEMEVVEVLTGTKCDLPFEPGQKFLIYARWEWGTAVTSRCMGSKLIEKANPSALGPSQQYKEKLYLHLRNACMGRPDTPCCLASLKAMSAGYYVPEPTSGCPAGMVPDRLRCAGSYTWCISFSEKDHRSHLR